MTSDGPVELAKGAFSTMEMLPALSIVECPTRLALRESRDSLRPWRISSVVLCIESMADPGLLASDSSFWLIAENSV